MKVLLGPVLLSYQSQFNQSYSFLMPNLRAAQVLGCLFMNGSTPERLARAPSPRRIVEGLDSSVLIAPKDLRYKFVR